MKSLLLISILLPTTIVTSTPVPSSSSTLAPSIIEGEGSIEVGSYLVQTISPTIDIVSLTGRGTPTKIPTLKPTFSPTDEGDGLDVEILIPGVSNNAAGEGGDDGGDEVATSSAVGDNEEVEAIPTYMPTYYPTAEEPEADQGLAFAGANAAMEGDDANGVTRLGSTTTIALLGSVVAVVGGLMAIR
mmetsp:Transcript_16445/g.26610  ORF Transcript_16445/g.26610 Transcript_16445/m.26610 type:complete len:187 (+) Transcript_16445:54-614(+)|eukprot:CAMPEP_0196143210 /NCGR_PEP_ID=MMETSP0910-20130528/12888_1 /TAXON_ID=49265 /ORGANISM="Thalassiosira rotula, Strain GSO102" /LENGTH=186 /DNA_ID=CAMNT_0041404625 /DNA_START=148 /DNA_END=708 /DNA_ORIENTATION=+